MRAIRILLVAVAVVLVFAKPAVAGQLSGRQFMVVFGYQGAGNRAVDSHTFATFIDGTALERGLRSNLPTISWLPNTGVVRPLRTEIGRNFSLEDTLRIARRNGYDVKAYGPYEISPQLYRTALDRIETLESGVYLYKMINGPLASGNAINCIHAVSDMLGHLATGTSWGFAASAEVVRYFAPHIRRYPQTNNAVADMIDLDRLVN